MCGLFCILRKRDQSIDETTLLKHLAVIRHRGPDQIGSFIRDGAGLAMARLSILDLSSPGLCPYVYTEPGSATPKAAVAFNGEIFNYIELRENLVAAGMTFETTSDTEVLLKAYLHWGQRFLEHLNGMFAFVIADFEGDLLIAGRDIAGEKPLYYYEDEDELIVASEIKAILSRIGTPDLNITDEFRAFEYMTGSETLFKNIFALLPAHRMVVRGLRGNYWLSRIDNYWDVSSDLMEVKPESAVDTLEELLRDAVRIRLRSDVPLGLYLSGGIDSSLLAYFARPERVFSVCFAEGPKYDELRYAEMVAREIGAAHVVIRPEKQDFEAYLDDILYHLDVPVGSFSAFPLFMLAREASKHVKIVLSGEGADELFSGYTRYLLPMIEERAYSIPELAQYHPLLDYYFGRPVDRFSRLLNRGLVHNDVVKSVIAPHFSRFRDLRHAMGYTEFKLMLVTLLQMEDRMAAAFGIENRSPFLDKRVISFAYSIPGDLKVRDNITKYVVREVAKRYVPKEICDRKEKLGLIAPINRWMGFGGRRGEFDRSAYNQKCFEHWHKIFFVEKRHLVAHKPSGSV